MTGFVVQGHKWVHPHNQYLLKVIANLKNEFEKKFKKLDDVWNKGITTATAND